MRRLCIRLLAAVAVIAVLGPPAAAAAHSKQHRPLVIGHRGAAGYLPDHTLQGYQLAIDLGADYIEPDLVSTKDGVLIARHEPNISGTTDVASKFPLRKRMEMIDGVVEEGYFVRDFTLKEIKTLRAVQPFAFRSQRFNGKFQIPTFDEILDLVARNERRLHKTIGVYPETKHPTYHKSHGLALEGKLIAALNRHHLNHRGAAVFIQSFEQSNLKKLNTMTPLPLVQLVDANDVNPDGSLDYTAPFDRPYDWTVSGNPTLLARTFGFFATNAGLAEIRTYADVISPWKRYIVSSVPADLNHNGVSDDENGDGIVNDEPDRKALPPTDLIQRAHAHGLKIHTWTFRDEQRYLLSDYGDNPLEEYLQFYGLGIDGVFSDYTGTAVAARYLFELLP
jgi:glycerophosphoryl diester phosphodiesterase